MLYIGESGNWLMWRMRFGEHRRAVTCNDIDHPDISMLVAEISDMKILPLCPISFRNNSRKSHEISPISKLGTVYPYGINQRFL